MNADVLAKRDILPLVLLYMSYHPIEKSAEQGSDSSISNKQNARETYT